VICLANLSSFLLLLQGSLSGSSCSFHNVE
jgi:hypothetical protein